MPRTFAPDAVTPDDALARLREGNRRFVNGDGNAIRKWQPGLVDGQQPFAAILGLRRLARAGRVRFRSGAR